jgi:hypothetical protein
MVGGIAMCLRTRCFGCLSVDPLNSLISQIYFSKFSLVQVRLYERIRVHHA